MEQKKTIWIAISTGVFLLVVLGAAIILCSQEAKKNTTAVSQKNAGNIWVTPNFQNDSGSYGDALTPSQDGNSSFQDFSFDSENTASAPAENGQELAAMDDSLISDKDVNFNEKPSEQAKTTASDTTIYSSGDIASVDIQTLNSDSASPVKAQNKAAEVAIRETNHENRIPETDTIYEPVKTSKTTVSETPKAKASAKPAPKTETTASSERKIWWIQVGSYSSKNNALEARSALDAEKIQNELFTYTDDRNQAHYRLRVGPYTTKGEAEYWKKNIDKLPKFSSGNSYVTETTVQQ